MTSRRSWLKTSTGLLALTLVPLSARGKSAELDEILRAHYGEREIRSGRVHLKLPALSENGNSVPLTVQVDSPMNQDEYVAEIAVFAEKNPIPLLARYRLTPASGRAQISARIRMFDTQNITVIAQMHDQSLWMGAAKSIVTLAACVDPYT
jgi:sulfur-oxidizing protein SoxY